MVSRFVLGSLVAILAALLFEGSVAFAQGVPAVSLSTNPTNPAPYETAVITTTSTVLDLSISTMVASVNGAKTYEGNVQPFSVTLGAPGAKTTVSVVITSGPKKYTQNLVFVPGDVALIVEPQSSAPPLYPGKPLVPLSGNVRVVAVTDFRTAAGVRISPSGLSYTWTIDDAVFQNYSGLGKDSVVASVPLQYRSRTVSVVVKTVDGTQIGEKTVRISGSEPSIRLYENDPLLGPRFERALSGTFTLAGSEVSFFGVPYSFGNGGGSPSMSWLLNGSAAQSGQILTLRPQGAGQGTASVSFSASKSSASENATSALIISFGKSSSGGLFGL